MSALGASSGADPFAQAIASIEHPLPSPPSGYKARLFLQFGLCGLLAVSSVLFLVLHVIYSRSIGKSTWFFKIQRVGTGRLIVVNSLVVFAVLSFVGAGGQFGSRWEDWRTLIKGELPYNDTMARFAPWLSIFAQAWFFSTTNLYATVAARRKFGTVSTFISHAWVQNFVLLVAPVVVICIILPLAIVNNNKQNELLSGSQALLPYLRTASQDLASGKGIDFEIIGKLTQGQTKLLAIQADEHKWLMILIGVCFVVAAAVIIMNAYSLLLVLTLRKHARETRERRSMQEKAISFTQAREVSIDLGQGDIAPDTTWPPLSVKPIRSKEMPGPFLAPSSQETAVASKPTFVPNQNDIALQRLTSDLSYAVPIVLIMCLVLICGLALVIHSGNAMSWVALEITCDIFAYTYLVFTTCAMCLFTLNLIRAWRTGKAMSDGTFSVTRNETVSTGQRFNVTLDPPTEGMDTEAKEKESDTVSLC